MANFCQQVLKPLGSYTRIFTVVINRLFNSLNDTEPFTAWKFALRFSYGGKSPLLGR